MSRMPDDLVERLATGDFTSPEDCPDLQWGGENSCTARRQAHVIAANHYHEMEPALMALITRIQEQDKEIEMLQYQTKWRKRRP